MQKARFEGTPPAATITRTLVNPTPNLPAAVTGFARIDGLATATTILKLLPKAGYTWDGFLILTPDTELSPDTELVI